MSYRTFKRVLGETSLERKCRFLFGGGLLLLITGSFWFYAQLNLGVVREQYNKRADLLITANLGAKHMSALAPELEQADHPFHVDNILEFANTLKLPDQREQSWRMISADVQSEAERRTGDFTEEQARSELVAAAEAIQDVEERLRRPPFATFADVEEGDYVYFRTIFAAESCLQCHQKINPTLAKGDLLGIAKISFPLADTEAEIAKNNAILIAMAIVTCFLAMLGAYAIVRYVIVKPVLHLKDVSDSVAQGDLDQRADIHTGDEFEELSHAFNRMLRRLVTVQDELRQVNTSLDAKVDELAQANLSLHEMNKLKSEFLATMSHELRTPLNSILGFSDLLTDASNLSERQQKYVGNIRVSGRNLLQLINDILDLAKMEAGKMDVTATEFSVTELLERLAVGMLPLAEKKNIELRWDCDPQVETALQDVGKLQQILYNLLSNAIKFTPEGGRVELQALPHERDQMDLIVADTGIGIPLDDQARIFEKFRQGRSVPGSEQALTREYEGTGLGLSIVKELAKLLGGEVLLESEFGKGSTFTVRLPLRLQARLDVADDDPFRRQTMELHRQQSAIEQATLADDSAGARDAG
ncbi:MAG: HAMP domain-containing protein [Planctomycetaceae bacterium]|nr:HAMP domain-containing protein [Planctomycetaceae bacterium]